MGKWKRIAFYGCTSAIGVTGLQVLYGCHNVRYMNRVMSMENLETEGVTPANQQTQNIYRKSAIYGFLPLNVTSRIIGKLATCPIPIYLRSPIYNQFIRIYKVNVDEMKEPDLTKYRTFKDFFTRELKPGIRPIDKTELVSPVDGRVMFCGEIDEKENKLEQVKGVYYSFSNFTGFQLNELQKRKTKSSNKHYQCIIYLAPKDYHHFHSPCVWQVENRRHFPGLLFSVKPSIVEWLQPVFSLNERVVYTGKWKHGLFMFSAVGATNVGSIYSSLEPNLVTNRWFWRHRSPGDGRTFFERSFAYDNVKMGKGDKLGHFNFGSTVVLIFEADKDFTFTVRDGDTLKFGQSIGK